jgi:hypothetical protein
MLQLDPRKTAAVAIEMHRGHLDPPVATLPNVSQFWTFKPEDFLKNPVYSRDYPPCTKC